MTPQLLPSLKEITSYPHRKGSLKLVANVFNERRRLPDFLTYYRRLGVEDFYIIDNNSDDGTHAYLLNQPDLHLFWTDQDFRASQAGRLWITNLCQVYGMGDWCLYVDADEFLAYPHYEWLSLPALTDYLDQRGFQGLFCLLCDRYSKGPMKDAVYSEGESLFQLCPYTDRAESFHLNSHPDFPYFQIIGGPRARRFWQKKEGAPLISQVPLVKWHEDFAYLASRHYCTPLYLADITGALFHFKFLSDFPEFAEREIGRGQRISDGAHYRRYLSAIREDPDFSFYDAHVSVRTDTTEDLLNHSLITLSEPFLVHLHQRSGAPGNGETRAEERFSRLYGNSSYSDLMRSWPFLINLLPQKTMSAFSENPDASQHPGQYRQGHAERRIERKLDRLLDKSSWKATRGIRRWLHRKGWIDRRQVPEDYRDYYLPDEIIQAVYDSFWWDLTFPLRIGKRLKSHLQDRKK
ncbi:glycosyltransferase family 2 protein [Fodinicurvata fenggangensis]|uniref:glycosyltransferase family 2 protein n=1 Tax=Fodinicurvata fenggangensis TaxID=1121830 RepID=UPI00068FAD34|nr:glycosyltransferase family 2 protein [Fodinicurvata fenggangensis]